MQRQISHAPSPPPPAPARSGSAASSSLAIPSRLSYSALVSLNYTRHLLNAGLAFSRGANGGSGVQSGSLSDSLSAVVSRSFGRDWSLSGNAGYTHTSSLSQGPTPVDLGGYGNDTLGNIDGVFFGAQASRRLGERFSAFAGYSATHQSFGNQTNVAAVTPYALNGLIQSFSIGVSFFPRSVQLGRF